MDRSITVRYFQVIPVQDRQLTFEEAVEAALGLGRSPHHREREVAAGVTIRLERAQRQGGYLVGEVVRVQRENIPPEAQQEGLVPLGIGGLGHSVTFAYDGLSRVIAIQFDPRGVSLGRFLDYLSAAARGARFRFETVVNEDAWARYNQGQPRSLKVSIAAPQNLERVEGPASSVIDSSRRLAEIAHAPVVTIEVSMGHVQRSHLAKRFVDSVLHALTAGDAADSVRTLAVKTKEEGLPTDTIDFLKDFARDKEVLDLPNNDHAENVRRRLRFIVSSFNDRLETLREMYGAA